MVKVLQLTSTHTPKDIRIFHKTACSLAQAGYQVTLLAPNAENEIACGVQLKGFFIPSGRASRFLLGPFIIARQVLRENPDIIQFHDPDLIPIGWLMRLLGKKVIYDVHEDYAAAVRDKDWMPRFLRPFVGILVAIIEQVSVRIFSATVAATPGIGGRFPASRTITTNNYPLPSEFHKHEQNPTSPAASSFVYAGNISRERGILQVLRACQSVAKTRSVTLDLAGAIHDDGLKEEILGAEYQSFVNYHGLLDRPELARLLSKSIAGLVTFLPLSNHLDSRPNKLFEYLSFGLPVIVSNFPAWREIVEAHDCGICVDPEDPEELAAAMLYFLENPDLASEMGKNGQKIIRENWNWNTEERKLLDLYANLVGASSTSSKLKQIT